MGIKNGAPSIVQIFRNGLFNTRADNYKIIVDGELMRYKGMIENNLKKHNAEEAIAASSFDYMKNIIRQIELFIGKKSKDVVVFMDGCRVFNKESGRADFHFDAGLIRHIFKNLCWEYGYTVNELDHGESELQMYLQRDRTMNLNIFLTNDSDMISICYGHKPIIKYINSEDKTASKELSYETIQSIIETNRFNSTSNTTHPIINQNHIYKLDNINILDSCLWLNNGKELTAVGFDFIEDRMKFNKFIFRVFIALCGTDFTVSLLTDSMISGILLSEKEDIDYLNTLTDVNDIACGLLMLGVRAGGTIKRLDDKSKLQTFSAADVEKAVKMYIDYIDTGKMENVTIPRPCMSLVCRHYLYAMKGQDSCFVKNALTQWAKTTSISEAISQMHKYLGTFNPMDKLKRPNKNDKESKTYKRVKTSNQDNDLVENILNCKAYSSLNHGSVLDEI